MMKLSQEKAGKTPQQARSRVRVAKILAASTELIREHGMVGLTMSAVARRAQIPIGSVYQFFPTKGELIHRLYLDILETFHKPAVEALESSTSPPRFARALDGLVHHIYRFARADRLTRDIWGGLQADREITLAQMKDNEFYSVLLVQMAERAGSALKTSELPTRATIVTEMLDASIRLAMTRDERSGLLLVAEAITIAIRELGFDAQGARRQRKNMPPLNSEWVTEAGGTARRVQIGSEQGQGRAK